MNMIQIVFGAKGGKAVEAHIKRLKARLKNFRKSVAQNMKAGAAAIGILGVAAVAVGKKLAASYMVSAAADAKRAAINKATGAAAGFTNRELEKQARHLERITDTSESVISSMQGVLLSFTNIRGDQFEGASLAALDMSAALKKAGADGETVENSVIQLGKALNDPIKGITALSRVGVVFTDGQRDQIRTMVEAGRTADAQKVILSELNREFGGTAEAVAAADNGLGNMSNELRHVAEEMGRTIVESDEFSSIIGGVADKARELAESGYIDLWAQNMRKAIKSLMPFVDKLGKGLGWVKTKIQEGAAFAGGFSGAQGSFSDRVAVGKDMAATTPARLKAETEEKLRLIRKAREAREDAAEVVERAEMKKAKAIRDTTEATTDATAAAKRQAEADKEAAKAATEAAAAATKRADLEKRAAGIQKQMDAENFRGQIEANLNAANGGIAADQQALDKINQRLAETNDQRRAREKGERQQARNEKNIDRLRDRREKGRILGARDKQLLQADDLRRAIAQKKRDQANAEADLQKQDAAAAKAQRQAQIAELGNIKKLLADNLKGVA